MGHVEANATHDRAVPRPGGSRGLRGKRERIQVAAGGHQRARHRQTARIKDGVKDKELTRGELDKLRADEAAIRAEERVYRKSGDGLSKGEVKDLEKDLNKTSKEIYRAKHNDRTPGGGGGGK